MKEGFLVLIKIIIMRDLTIEDAVSSVKYLIEKAIRDGGMESKNNLIRTQQPIRMLLDFSSAKIKIFVSSLITSNNKKKF